MALWRDMDKMFKDIYEYVQETGDMIVSADNPKQLIIGFKAITSDKSDDMSIVREIMEIEPRTWEIPFTAIRTYAGKFREHMKTGASRQALATSIPGQIVADPTQRAELLEKFVSNFSERNE